MLKTKTVMHYECQSGLNSNGTFHEKKGAPFSLVYPNSAKTNQNYVFRAKKPVPLNTVMTPKKSLFGKVKATKTTLKRP
jgi:hypothetical protein